jgi:hypothetical protein
VQLTVTWLSVCCVKTRRLKYTKNVISRVVLSGRHITLSDEHRLRVFKNGVLRRIFGPERDEMTGGWKKLFNVELHHLYSSRNVVKMCRLQRMRQTCAHKMLVRKHRVKRSGG